MATTINLDATAPSELRPSSARERAKAKLTANAKEAKKPAASKPPSVEAELRSRLSRTFGRIVEALKARGDDELATVVDEDSDAMSQGLISLTSHVKPLRGPLLFGLAFIEPVLAFGRVGRILSSRWVERRARKYEQQEGEQPT
jgi:hypothetical protein